MRPVRLMRYAEIMHSAKRLNISMGPERFQYQKIITGLVLLFAFSNSASPAEIDFQNAVRSNNLNAISQLISTTNDVNQRGANGKTALMIAARVGDAVLVRKLLDAGADPHTTNINGGTAIMFAAIKGDIETITVLIKSRVDVSVRGSNGWSSLMIAASKGHVNAMRLILGAGADINTTDIYLWTPLLRAAYENRIEVTRVLLEHQHIDVQHQDEHGATALHHAAAKGNTEIVELLLRKGLKSDKTDFSGRTPVRYARDSGLHHLAQTLESFR
jgi:ankyrin repeat protein